MMPLAVLDGRYTGMPANLRFCICSQNVIEDIAHYVLRCSLYSAPRDHFLSGLQTSPLGLTGFPMICYQLADVDTFVTSVAAVFVVTAGGEMLKLCLYRPWQCPVVQLTTCHENIFENLFL